MGLLGEDCRDFKVVFERSSRGLRDESLTCCWLGHHYMKALVPRHLYLGPRVGNVNDSNMKHGIPPGAEGQLLHVEPLLYPTPLTLKIFQVKLSGFCSLKTG